ncbi:MAG: metallophosphoesterase, partial [Sedimentisphaerales bacterium]|nr:metallophosphoesterase [Sedimentisphaerales bacterium]
MIERCKKATEINRSGRYRKGNVIKLPEQGDVIITGDLHGHRRNFERIVKYADLDNHPDRRVVLHEILHGGPEDDQGGCLSYELFDNVLQYKIDYPDQVHLIMGNHDTAIITNSDVMKSGK